MLVRVDDETVDLRPADRLVFGRSPGDGLVVAPDDRRVSRSAGELEFDVFAWRVTNIGRRSFSLVMAGRERELLPSESAPGDSSALITHRDAWLRIPGSDGDHAIEVLAPENERPAASALGVDDLSAGTVLEQEVVLTVNELTSVVAVYEGYLALPPTYRREPNSYRAAARRLRVEEGKIKADLRRVQQKVARAGGPEVSGARSRDTLIMWLVSRDCVSRDDLELLG